MSILQTQTNTTPAKFSDDTDLPTPGTDYYKFRRILGDHALRYMDENPIAAIRFTDS